MLGKRSMTRRFDEFFLQKEYAHISPAFGEQSVKECGVRIYLHSPETVAFQIRTWGPTTSSGRGKCKLMFAHVNLTIQDIDQVIAELSKQREELVARRAA